MLPLKDPTLLKTQSLIDNQWIDATDGTTIDVTNPFDNQVLASVPSLEKSQVIDAVAIAHEAQIDWAQKTANERAAILNNWADLIDQNKEDLATIMTAEQGKPITESRGEIGYANSFIRWFAEEGKRIYGDIIPSTNKDLRYVVLKQPIGVCAAITPWNFPAAMITRKVAPALAAGCSIIVKPATETPLTALALGELAIRAGLPAGLLQIVTGKSSVIGEVLIQDERIHKLSFTGSTEVGRTLMAQCASTVKKLSMELGGNAPFIVFDDADLEKAATGLIASKYRNAGQTCVCANRVYVQSSIKDKFLAIFKQKVEALKVGNGMTEGVNIGPLINQGALDKVEQLLADAVNKGATVVTGGKKHSASDLSFEPTVITGITDDMDIATQEIFGPIAPVFVFDSDEEVIAHANNTIYGLAAYFYTQSVARSWKVCEGLEYGMVAQNTGLLSTEVAPFGGVKQSGFGREGSKYGIEDYVTTKYWCIDVQ
nr:NAD-dependent succinate-semialdehyde dehydrogenase [Moraxella sp. CTOTU48841]